MLSLCKFFFYKPITSLTQCQPYNLSTHLHFTSFSSELKLYSGAAIVHV